MDIISLFGIGFVLFCVWLAVQHFFFSKKKRRLWAGSEPITDEALRQWFFEVWWETYAVIDPEDRINHEPTPHWWIYKDHPTFLPDYLGRGIIGWWAKEQRAIFVTEASKRNRNLVRHECAHDIMNALDHREKYFSAGTYVMRQFQ